MGRLIREVMSNMPVNYKNFELCDLFGYDFVVPNEDQRIEAILLGEWWSVGDHDDRTHQAVKVRLGKLNGVNYILGAEFV